MRQKTNIDTASAKPSDLIQPHSGPWKGAQQNVDFCEHSQHICSWGLKHQLPHLEAILSRWETWPKTLALTAPGINLPVSTPARCSEYSVEALMIALHFPPKHSELSLVRNRCLELGHWQELTACAESHVALAPLCLRTEERWEGQGEGREVICPPVGNGRQDISGVLLFFE